MIGINYLFNEIKKEKELVKSSLAMLIVTGFASIITFVVDVILGRIFGPESFGNFRTVFYLLSFFFILIEFGASVTLTKYIAQFRIKDKKKIGYMTRWFMKLRIISYSVLLILTLLLINPISNYFLHDLSLNYLILFGIPQIIATIFNVFPSMALGYENFNLYMASALIKSLGYIIFAVGLGYFFGVGYALLGFGIANILGNLICSKFLIEKGSFRKDGEFDVKKVFYKFSIPMHIFTLPSSFGNAIVPLLSLFFTMERIGQYSFSFLFYVAGLVIPGVLSMILLPKISRWNASNNSEKIHQTLKKVFLVYTVIVICGINGALLFGKTFLSIFAPEYLSGLLFFKVLVSFGLIAGYLVIYNSYLTAKEKIKEVAILTLIQNFLLFLVSFILLRSF